MSKELHTKRDALRARERELDTDNPEHHDELDKIAREIRYINSELERTVGRDTIGHPFYKPWGS